jgi:hypothetical protein
MKSPAYVISLLLLCLCLTVVVGCGGGSSGAVQSVTRFSITAPAVATAGTAVNFTVTALDSSSNTVASYAGRVHFSSTDGHAKLPADSTLTNGSGTFSATLEAAGSETITASDSMTASLKGTSNSIQVSASVHFSLTVPGVAAAGSAFNFSVTAIDTSGNTITGYSGTVAFASSDAQAMLPANSTLTNGAGAFSVTLETLGPQTIKATDTSTAAITATSNAIQVITPAGRFTPTGSLMIARENHAAILLQNGKVLVAGGIGGAGSLPLASAELYDPVSGTFSEPGEMQEAREGPTATLLNTGQVLVCELDCELFDPATSKFSSTAYMVTARYGHTATLLKNGKVLVVGGYSQGMTLASAEIYDPSSGTFSQTGSMSVGRSEFTATLLSDGRVLVAGGRDPNDYSPARAEVFDPATGTFTPTAPMRTPTWIHGATLLQTGQVLVLGGYDNVFDPVEGRFYSHPLATAELFDPVAGTFTPTGTMQTARVHPMVVLLKNGTVLVAGGGDTADAAPASAEIYDPTTGMFTPTGSMETGRAYAAAAMLENGSVLVSGGEGAVDGVMGFSVTSAELYQ